MNITRIIAAACLSGSMLTPVLAAWDDLPPVYIFSKYNQVHQRQAHNAYDSGHKWTQNFDEGVFNVEIDIRNDSDYDGEQNWKVAHHATDNHNDNECGGGDGSLRECLRDIKAWHDQHPHHFPITIIIDKKDEWYCNSYAQCFSADYDRTPTDFDELLDEELGEDNIFRPNDLRGDYLTLRDAAADGAWPPLKHLSGKFIVIITPHESPLESRSEANRQKTAVYVEERGEDALAFVCPRGHANEIDSRVSGFSTDESDWVVCFNHKEDQISGDGGYGDGSELSEAGYLLRVWSIGSTSEYNNAIENSEAVFIAVDRKRNGNSDGFVPENSEGVYGAYNFAPLIPVILPAF